MKFELESHHRNVPDQNLLDDLASVAKKINRSQVTIDQYNDHGRFHSTTITRRFGSWFTALEKAGLEKTRNLNISNQDLFENLVDVWTVIGRQPKYNDLRKPLSRYSAGTYEKRFKGWRNSLEAFVSWVSDEEIPTMESLKTTKKSKRTPRNINWRLRAMVLMKDGATCKLCGATPNDGAKLQVDHIVPWANGGETVIENLQILCYVCNMGKSNVEIQDS